MKTVTIVIFGIWSFTAQCALGEESESATSKNGRGTLVGTIAFEGDIPSRERIVRTGDSSVKDSKKCAQSNRYKEDLIVDAKSHGIANVYIYMRRKPVGWNPSYDISKPLVIETRNCRYTPHTSLSLVGQKILVKSRDADVAYNPHFYSIKNPPYCRLTTIAQTDLLYSEVFHAAESVPVQLRCDIHSWMKAWVLVLDHPFAAITNRKGEFTIPNIPAGTHVFRVWHERTGWLEKNLTATIVADQTNELGTRHYTAKLFELVDE